MLNILLNLVRERRTPLLGRDIFQAGFRNRLPLMIFLLSFQALYFPINQYLSAKGGGTNVAMSSVDGNMPLLPVFVVAYALGFAVMPLLPLYAAWKFPRDLFQQYAVAFFLIMCCGYTIWLVFPAYVVKAPIEGDGFFTGLIKMLHSNDDNYGTYNAVPSSHVYYVTLAMCYYLLYNRRLFIPFSIFAVCNALSTMFTHQHYFIDVITGFALVWAVYGFSQKVVIPALKKWEAHVGVTGQESRR